ncbi:hypothetical protein ACQP2U_42945 (plasmid) [Nocardia sp. CA-084685]|uniref:hypothetical protein n=1 Tax=Nocardia sp. CA-084685 TaxID=3239970 RepID=UPI003D97C338
MAFVLGMVAAASAAELPVALVDFPAREDLQAGLLAVHEMGGTLGNIAVLDAQAQPVTAVHGLLDGMALVVAGLGRTRLTPSTSRILVSRAHTGECTLVFTDGQQCPGADLHLTAHCTDAEGLSRHGRGYLKAQTYSVEATPKGGQRIHGEFRKDPRPGRVEWAAVEAAVTTVELPTGTG